MAGISDEELEKSITDVKFWLDKSGKGVLFRSLPLLFEKMEKATIAVPTTQDDDGLEEIYCIMGKFEWDFFQRLTTYALVEMENGDPTDKSFALHSTGKGRHYVYGAYLEARKPSEASLKQNKVFMIYHMHPAAAMNSVEDIRLAERFLKDRIQGALKKYPGNLCYGLLIVGGKASLYRMDGDTYNYKRVLNGQAASFDLPPDPGMFRPITDPDLIRELVVLVNTEWLRIDREHVRWTLHDRRFHPHLRNPFHLREMKGCDICSEDQPMTNGVHPSNTTERPADNNRKEDDQPAADKKPKHEDASSGNEMSVNSAMSLD